ncbi:DNA topoisomerase 2-binding protein 1 [Phoenix dactylifera]|uniref:DNA topoisomerase 2-binding protein 1 n=1 Tax=Phoenix dactylifera TaxID=42345 RepID=A0A8B9AEC8_PHODC|nr:DNA topoisomerase 2-binding protein 1 [Phoenix dactylifera]
MEPIMLGDDDSADRSQGDGIRPIPGMESVIVTVSGYHGTERFKLIKLIAQTGASYVGAMGRSTTHLVCWQFEGKKYELARNIGAHIISHRWFEACLKKGKRLPEGPYTMQSGWEAGPISWEVPAVLDTHDKKKCVVTRERNVLSDQSHASNCSRAAEIDARCFDVEYSNWSDTHLLKENFFPSWDTEMMGSKNVRKIRKASKQGCTSSNKAHLGPPNIRLYPQPEESSSFPSLCSSRKKRSLFHATQNEVTGEPAHRSRRLVKKNASFNHLNDIIPGSRQEPCLTEINNHLDLPDYEGSRTQGLEQVEDIERPRNHPLSEEPKSSRSCHALSEHEINSKCEHCQYTRENIDSSDFGVNHDRQSKEDNQSESASVHKQAELSCVICWTDFSSTRGVLPCGHRFCYLCILGWADCMASKGKVSTCPLCKASFASIRKMEEAGSPDQKIYSQTIPCGSSNMDFMLFDRGNYNLETLTSDFVCYQCHNHEPADLLVSCHICQTHWVHSCCLDPPLVPWTCMHCRDLRMLYQRFR